MSLTSEVKEIVMQSGFDLVGITKAEPFPDYIQNIEEGVNAKRLPLDFYLIKKFPFILRLLFKMQNFKLRESQWYKIGADPKNILPSVKSIIIGGIYYLDDRPVDMSATGNPCGRIGRLYTSGLMWERDSRFIPLIKFLKKKGFKACGYWGPPVLPEKLIAVRTGLGWYGKNSLIRTEKFGSWITTAPLLTDAELEYDTPYKESKCKGCQTCVISCPTGALSTPYKLDVSKCICFHIGYSDKKIPLEIRKAIGNRLCGCDLCQEVCPNNKSLTSKKSKVTEESQTFSLIPILTITQNEFCKKYKMKLSRGFNRKRLRRNAVIALGNIGDDAAVPSLIEALQDKDDILRSYAAWSLGKIGSTQAKSALDVAFKKEPNPEVKTEIENALNIL